MQQTEKKKLLMLKLVLPEEKYWQSFQEGLLEYKNSPSPYDIQGIKKAFAFKNFAEYKSDCEDKRSGKNLPSDYVPNTYLWLIYNEKFIGIYDVRHNLTKYLKISGGHIAYSIIPSARRKGFAAQGLKLCCKYAHNKLNIKEVLISCNATNIASYKTMKKVMKEFGEVEDMPAMVDNHEEKRVWIRIVEA